MLPDVPRLAPVAAAGRRAEHAPRGAASGRRQGSRRQGRGCGRPVGALGAGAVNARRAGACQGGGADTTGLELQIQDGRDQSALRHCSAARSALRTPGLCNPLSHGFPHFRTQPYNAPGTYDSTGFHAKRMEFDPEYDNDAETIVADMEFNEYDTPADVQMKVQMLQLYNRCGATQGITGCARGCRCGEGGTTVKR